MTAQELLRTYGLILDELSRRSVIRTRSSPVGDYAEYLVSQAFDATLEPNSHRSWDMRTQVGKHIQVKCRVRGPSTRPSAKFSVFRSFDFDSCVFVLLEQGSYDIVSAVEVPVEQVKAHATFSKRIAGSFVRISTNLQQLPGAKDVTESVRLSAHGIERGRAPDAGRA